ncbi:putative LSM domain, FDF domain, DFDF domain-containing protein [Lupinus albus]|uniref:Putative LSM domain, FDF domain, DFDF domain-containing protein n=1 Tax=Lupinus albus TaxID=3870 RepID=A0A6A4NPQ7_LUPAL|nr:putative LSM domain, FDF domain, DFDF domain-containing protein [Lupinus albus]
MASENASRSNSAADSYIGSLISLTSKSEIRYEGVLYNINTEESSIGLRNVRSFGTEGRKKDGQQIPPGDKVYEYILFRGSDIKDLQVKSSPPVQPTPQVSNDPAIIQSHYPRPVTTSTSLPNVASGSLADLSSHATQHGLHGSNFQGPLPLYQPGGNIGSWGASPPAPNANGGGIAMPMYWQGYYGAPNGLPHLHQQSLLRPPGLSMPSSMQQPMQYPNYSLSLPTGSSNLPELPSSLLPFSTSAHSVTSASLPPSDLSPVPSSLAAAPSAFPEAPSVLHPAPSALPPAPSTLPLAPSGSLASETFPVPLTNKALNVSPPAVTPAANLPSLTPLTNSGSEMNAIVPPIFSKANATSGSSSTYQTVSQLLPSIVGSSKSIHSETPTPSLVTPGQLLQPGPTVVSTAHPSQTPHKDVEVVQVSSTSSPQPSLSVSAENQPPILPLPVTSRSSHRPVGAPIQTHHGYGYRGRGRGRGTGVLRPITKFTEEFDFMAMNEKFKKDEVWGDLGKSNKSHSKEKDGEENSFDEDYIQDEDNDDSSNFKPVYNKDDFFDSLSSNALDQASQNGRIRYSEQIKIDTETFGNFVRPRGGRGGRGPFRGGHLSRGGYYGRGYGYSGRGRGRGMPSRSS